MLTYMQIDLHSKIHLNLKHLEQRTSFLEKNTVHQGPIIIEGIALQNHTCQCHGCTHLKVFILLGP